MRRLLLVAALAAAAAPTPGAAAAGAVGLSASPAHLTLTGVSRAVVTVRNPSRRSVVVDVSRAGFARSLHGRPLVTAARTTAGWLRLRPRRLRIGPHGAAKLHVTALPPRDAAPGDHPALVLLTTRPVASRRVRVRLRVGIVVRLRVPGRIVRRLEPRALIVRRQGSHRVLELRLANRGNVTEQLGGSRLRIVLFRLGHRPVTLRPQRLELLPHSSGIADFVYRGRARGTVLARVVIRPSAGGRPRSFRIRL